MKTKNPLKKFIYNKSAIVFLTIIAVILGIIYFYTVNETSQLSLQISNMEEQSPSKSEILQKHNKMQTQSEIVLVVFSVTGSALVSALLIDKRNSNKIVEEIVVNDFFTSEKFLELLDDNKKKQVLTGLEKQLKFDGCQEKFSMYLAVKEKLNEPIFDKDLVYEKYYLDVVCDVKDEFIEKTFVKDVEIKSLGRPFVDKEYVLLSIITPTSTKYSPAEITKVEINNEDIDLKLVKSKIKDVNNTLNKIKGYNKKITFILDKTLDFSNKKSIKIKIEYTTRCPLYDRVYTCRMPHPCKKFDFNFFVNSEEFVINPAAFGFIDDATNSPNHTNDRKRVSIKFDDWIFPLDGVCVYLEKNVAK